MADDEPNERFRLYTRGNTGEVFPHVVTALTGTLIGAEVQAAQLDVFRQIGLLTKRDLGGPSLGTGVFGGYLYGSGSLARLFGVRTPGMTASSADEQVFGRVAGAPPYRRAKGDRNLSASIRVTAYLLKILRRPDLSDLDRDRAEAKTWLASLPPPSTASDEELLAFVATYPPRLQASMARLLRYGMLAAGPRALVDQVLDRAGMPPGLANRIVGGVGDVDSAQLAYRIWSMGRLVAADPLLAGLFDSGLYDLGERLAGTALAQPLQQFLTDHGHRGSDEYELASPSWSMDPRPVLAAIDRLRHAPADRDPALAAERLRADRVVAEREAAARVRGPLRALLRRASAVSRAGSVGRERAKDILVLENLGARLALHELLRRAAERGGPTDHRRGFCVTAGELADYVARPEAFAAVIEERSAQEAYLNEREPPLWFEGHIPDPATWPRRAAGSPADLAGPELAGIAVSGGRAAGPARVIADPADPRGLAPGEVLVCAITDPAWTPLFLMAAAVVCESGALQSHAAIVARELGIPAVLSVPGITAVADGAWLEVDGDTGSVRVGSAVVLPPSE